MSTRHALSQAFHDAVDEIVRLHDKKQQDYGSDGDPFANIRAGAEAWGLEPWVGAMVRASDKVKRLQTFAQKGVLANEGVEDSFQDLAVYALIALVLFRESKGLPQQENVDTIVLTPPSTGDEELKDILERMPRPRRMVPADFPPVPPRRISTSGDM